MPSFSLLFFPPTFTPHSLLLPPSSFLSVFAPSPSFCLSDLAAVVRGSAGGHAGFPGSQTAARGQPPAPSQPGRALPAHQHTPTERQEPQLSASKQDQGEERVCTRAVSVHVPVLRFIRYPSHSWFLCWQPPDHDFTFYFLWLILRAFNRSKHLQK